MVACFNGCGMIAVFPEGAFSLFPLVIFLARPPGDQLHASRNNIVAAVQDHSTRNPYRFLASNNQYNQRFRSLANFSRNSFL